VRVEVSKPATAAVTINQLQVSTGREPSDKRATLRQLLRSAENFKNAIIFCNRKREVALLHKSLVSHGFNAVALHGDLDQSARTAALDAFRKGDAKLLIASDVAARGLDIPAVSHIFNFDVPHHPDDYVHRIGRTGRAGLTGTSITLVAPLDGKSVAAIERLVGYPIPRMDGPAPAENLDEDRPIRESRPARDGRGERGGRHRGGQNRQAQERQPQDRQPQGRREPPHRRPDQAHNPAPAPAAARMAEPPQKLKREPAEESSDASHLPAFLLRPITLKA
jgi:superfamily II DNA/RNA helicase